MTCQELAKKVRFRLYGQWRRKNANDQKVKKAPSTQAARGHTEVTPIFLHHNVRGHFGSAEQRMLRLIDGERLRNTLRISRIIELKARLALPHPDGIR